MAKQLTDEEKRHLGIPIPLRLHVFDRKYAFVFEDKTLDLTSELKSLLELKLDEIQNGAYICANAQHVLTKQINTLIRSLGSQIQPRETNE